MTAKNGVLFGLMVMTIGTWLVGCYASVLFGQTGLDPALSLTAKLPPDVHPDTLSRAVRTQKDDLTTDGEKEAFDRMSGVSPSQPVSKWLGPTGTRLQIPELAETYSTQLKLLHSKGTLGDKYYELVIAVAMRETNNKEEWLNHEAIRAKLLSPRIEEVLRSNLPTTGLDEKDAMIIQYGRELFRDPKVSSETFAAMQRLLGSKNTLVATLTMAYYDVNGLLIRAYDQRMDTSPTCTGNGCLSERNIHNAW